MRCVEIESLLSDYADGLGGDRDRRIVERHLQLCEDCRQGVLLARRLGQQLTRLSLLPIGVLDRAPRMRARLEQELRRGRRRRTNTVATRALLALIVGLLGVLLLILVVNVGV
ncbi:MAG TPA: zf-HC2 domain-containing protein [Herpetosiphonaceae bacterium]|nr:zf-HC2 domain-containing protein [Herpetosiphonaceae bacterium]